MTNAPDPDSAELAARVAEAKAIKETRDRERRENRERQEAAMAEEQGVRNEKVAAGLLGRCPICHHDVDTAEGIVLRHAKNPDLSTTMCDGTGEPMQSIAGRRDL
jgi:hypothetical protein